MTQRPATTRTAQHPIGTGFTAENTADDVLKGVDLTGKNAVVTGGHNGIGLETVRALSKAGAAVTVAARNPARAARNLAGIDRTDTARLDLLDPASVDAFAAAYTASGRPLDMLVNNAGIMAGPLVRDARGYEAQFATNHLGHFQLTLGLLPALRAARGARVVNLTSGGHRLSDIRWDDPHFTEPHAYDDGGMLAYGQSKTANVLFAVALDRRWAADGIRGFAVHPGIVMSTSLGPWIPEGAEREPWLSTEQLQQMGLADAEGELVLDPDRELKTPQQGASTSAFGAASPLLDGLGGLYLRDNDVSELDEHPKALDFATGDVASTVVPYAIDPEAAERLWTLSERLIAR